MIKKHLSDERGFAQHEWLKSYHSFSFANYYNPDFINFGPLRVINEDFIAPHQGFGAHPHKNMEIITYILKGELEHQDSLGNKEVIKEGELQIMSAGLGVVHSEFNTSSEETHLLQVWIIPDQIGIKPRYEQKKFILDKVLTLVASPSAKEKSFKIHQDALVYIGRLEKHKEYCLDLTPLRQQWVQVISGELEINDQTFIAGDAAMINFETLLTFKATENSHFLVFDLVP